MAVHKKEIKRKERRTLRTRIKIKRTACVPRVSVFRSLKHIYAQIIDDTRGHTLVSFCSQELKNNEGDKKVVARSVGQELAKKAHAQGIVSVVFDRGGYKYHGRVKELAEGLRSEGLVF